MCLVAYQISFSSTCYCKCFYILHVHVHINWLLNQKINITRELTFANMRKFSKPMMYISATCLVSSKRNVSSTGYILWWHKHPFIAGHDIYIYIYIYSVLICQMLVTRFYSNLLLHLQHEIDASDRYNLLIDILSLISTKQSYLS